MTLGNLLRDQLIPFGIVLAEQVQPIGQQIQDTVKSIEKSLHTPIISINNQTTGNNIQDVALPVLSNQRNYTQPDNAQNTVQLISASSTQTSAVEDSAKTQTNISEQPSEVVDNGTFFDQISAARSSVIASATALRDSVLSTLSPLPKADSVEDDDMPDLIDCSIPPESVKPSPIANPIVSKSPTAVPPYCITLSELNDGLKAVFNELSKEGLPPSSQTATPSPTVTVSDKEKIDVVKGNDDSSLKLGTSVVQEIPSSVSTSSVPTAITSVLEISSPVTTIVNSVIDQTTSDNGNLLNQLSAASSTIVASANSLKESILSTLVPSSKADENPIAQKTTPVVEDSARSISQASIPVNNSNSAKPKSTPREVIYVIDEDDSGLELLPPFFQEPPKKPSVAVSNPQKAALPKKDNISPYHSINNQNNVLNNRTKPPHATMHSVSGRPPAKDIKIPDSVIKMFMRTKR